MRGDFSAEGIPMPVDVGVYLLHVFCTLGVAVETQKIMSLRQTAHCLLGSSQIDSMFIRTLLNPFRFWFRLTRFCLLWVSNHFDIPVCSPIIGQLCVYLFRFSMVRADFQFGCNRIHSFAFGFTRAHPGLLRLVRCRLDLSRFARPHSDLE